MICDLKQTIRLFKEGRISDLVLARSLTDYIRPISPLIKVKVIRQDTQTNAGLIPIIQTLPERHNGRLCSVIMCDWRTMMTLETDDIIEIIHKEVKNNTNYIRFFAKFLAKNNGMIIERAESLAALLELSIMSYNQMSPAILKRVKDSGAAFISVEKMVEFRDKLLQGRVSFLKAQEFLELEGMSHAITNCAETIACASGADVMQFDIDYSVKIDSLKNLVKEVKKTVDNVEGYVSDKDAHTAINNAADVADIKGGRFLYSNKQI